MNIAIKKTIQNTFMLIVVTLLAVYFTSPIYFSQLRYKPANHVFIGMTAYFEDFYYYMDQFYQGKEGNWLTRNRFAPERFPATIIYFNHILLGKIGGLFHLEPYDAYNFFGLAFKFLFILSSYFFIAKLFTKKFPSQLTAFLIFLCSTSLPNISVQEGVIQLQRTYDVFRSANRVLARFGTSPNGMLTNFLFVVLTLYLLRILEKELSHPRQTLSIRTLLATSHVHPMSVVLICLAMSLLIVGDPVIAVMIPLSIGILMLWNKATLFRTPKSYGYMLLLLVICAGVGWIYIGYVQIDPVYKAANEWDISQYFIQMRNIGLWNYLKSFGLQLPFGIAGLVFLILRRRKTLYQQYIIIGLLIALAGYVLPLAFHMHVPGFRFLFPAIYMFNSVCVLYAIMILSRSIPIKHVYAYIVTIYITINLISFFRSWNNQFQPLTEPLLHFAYIPHDLYDGLMFLRSAKESGNVIASSATSIDLMIPGLTGKRSYSGHSLTTYRAKTRDNNSSKFFFEWTDGKETRDFLKSNNIRYVFATTYEGVTADLKIYYPFLQVIYENPMVTIFRYDGG